MKSLFSKPSVNDYKPVAILGNPNSGKTNLMFYLASLHSAPKRYILGYPTEVKGFVALSNIQDVSKISECVLLIDEIDEIIPFYEKRSNEALKRLLKFTAHNNIKLIFSTQLSQFVSKMMEALVPQWAITQIDIFTLKNGSKPKRILIDYVKKPEIINKEIGMKLPLGQFVWYNDQGKVGETGIYRFPDMKIGKDWGIAKEKPTETLQKPLKEKLIVEVN